MFHAAFVFEHEHRIHKCIFMHTIFVTIHICHICLLPTTFSAWQLVPESLSARDMPRWQDEYGNIQMKEAMRPPVLFGMLGVKAAFHCPLGWLTTGFSNANDATLNVL